jgi:Tfp pilus assembly protein PilV
MRLRGAHIFVRLRLLGADERGSHLVEVAVAALVMSVAVIGVIGSMGSGMQLVGHARQRSSASAVAQERLERARSIPYERVATYEQPTHNSDPDHPDNRVSTDNASYLVEDGPTEPLIVDTVDGALKHLDDPFTLGNTEFSVHQYVTWVDDATIAGTQDYKRVIAIVTWKFPVQSGSTRRVFFSTFVSDGTVSVPTPSPVPSPTAGPTPTPSAPPPTADPGSCPGDTSPPVGTFELLSGAGAEQGYTNATTVQVGLTATDPCADIVAELSNDGSNFTPTATVLSGEPTSITWTIPGVDGSKTVHARFRDGAGNTSSPMTDELILDETKPTTPGDLREVNCSLSGPDRTVTLTWNGASDTNFLGYRLYRSIEQAAYQAVATTGTVSASDTTRKNLNSVQYVVRSYDQAGNESEDSNALSFSKSSC